MTVDIAAQAKVPSEIHQAAMRLSRVAEAYAAGDVVPEDEIKRPGLAQSFASKREAIAEAVLKAQEAGA